LFCSIKKPIFVARAALSEIAGVIPAQWNQSAPSNFRKKLWTKEKAQSIMKPLMQFVDVCIGNEEDAEALSGLQTRR